MFHHFHGHGHPRVQGSISADELELLLEYVGKGRVVDPAEWLEQAGSGQFREDAICLTFDDALRCQVDVAAPVLERLGLRAFWFIYSSPFKGQLARFEVYRLFRTSQFPNVETFYSEFFARIFGSEYAEKARAALSDTELARRKKRFPFYSDSDIKFRLIRDHALDRNEYEAVMDSFILEHGLTLEGLADGLWMTDEHLRALAADGHAVGLHSYSHPMVMGRLARDEQRAEYERNYAHLCRVTGRKPLAMAHPAGSYNQMTLDILESLGILCGFCSSMTPPDGAALNPSRMEIAREDHANVVKFMERQ